MASVSLTASGISFADYQTPLGGMTSELLDHYEEGTWDAVLSSTGGSITTNASLNQCRYRRIGGNVTVCGQVQASSVSSPTGAVMCTLPITVLATAAEHDGYTSAFIRLYNLTGAINAPSAYFEPDTAYLKCAEFTGTTDGDLAPHVQGASHIMIGGTYQAS